MSQKKEGEHAYLSISLWDSFIRSFFKNYSFNKYLSDCYFLEPTLDARTVRSNKIDKNLCPHGVGSQAGKKASDVMEKNRRGKRNEV